LQIAYFYLVGENIRTLEQGPQTHQKRLLGSLTRTLPLEHVLRPRAIVCVSL
jgi:hypothetical protein